MVQAKVSDELRLRPLLHVIAGLAHFARELHGGGTPKARNLTYFRIRFKQYVDEFERKKNRTKSRVRARVEHPFRILEACSRLRQGEISWSGQEPPPAVRQLRSDQLCLHRKRLAMLAA